MSSKKQAIETFRINFNCAQSVLSAFCETYGLDRKTALKLTSGLGAGFRSGEVCGAVSGAVLVIGLKDGQCESEDMQAKRECYQKTEEFLRRFREKNDSILCRDLMGYDISTTEGREKAQREHLFKTICEHKIASAVEILESMGY